MKKKLSKMTLLLNKVGQKQTNSDDKIINKRFDLDIE